MPVISTQIVTKDGVLGTNAVRPGFVVELMVGEELKVLGSKKPASISGGDTGHRGIVVDDMVGNTHRIAAVVCETGLFDRVESDMRRRRKNSGVDVGPSEVRAVIRSLANNHERFDGTTRSIDGLNLQNFGA